MTVIHNANNEVIAEVTQQAKWVQAVSLKLESIDDARRFQQMIEAALKAGGTRRILVDARQAQLTSVEVNESMWTWVRTCQHFDFLAIVNQSSVMTVAAQMKARALGTTKVQVFDSFHDAVHWLGAKKPG